MNAQIEPDLTDSTTAAVMALSNGDVATIDQIATSSGESIDVALLKLESLLRDGVVERCVEAKGKYVFWRLAEQYLDPLEPLFSGERDMNYTALIHGKSARVSPSGIPHPPELNDALFDFQREVTRWALRKGRAAIFLDTGLGKTWCAVEWSRVVAEHTGKPVMILTPLAVAKQFVSEGAKLGVNITLCRESEDVSCGVNVCNYDRAERFDVDAFGGIVLDESSILKDFTGKMRNMLIERYGKIRFKLCATATPAPNDHTELGNHAEFLGVMSRTEMLSSYFVHDAGKTQDWRLKGHAKRVFWSWVASWAIAIRSPSDLGFDDALYMLPPLAIKQVTVGDSLDMSRNAGLLIGYQASTLSEHRAARRASLSARVASAAKMVNGNDRQWIVWCDLNDESRALADAIPDSVEVRGSHSQDHKESSVWGFIDGSIRVLVTKPSICGMGLNMQNCADMVFVGLGYSWEMYYQAIRRSWRFGQKKPVTAVVVTSEAEGKVVDAIQRKQADADSMASGMIEHMRDVMRREIAATDATMDNYNPTEEMRIPEWL